MFGLLRKAFRVAVVLQIPAIGAAAMMMSPSRGVDFRTTSLDSPSSSPAPSRSSTPREPDLPPLELSAVFPAERQTASGLLASSLSRPSPLPKDEEFYKDYVSSLDDKIVRDYQDRWGYHNMQMAWMMSVGNDIRHVNIGSLGAYYDGAPREEDVRRNFAEQVLRMRLDMAMRTYFRPKDRGEALKKTEAALNAIKNKRVTLTSDNQAVAEVRMGYDVFTDFAKVEYVHGAFQSGFYHSFFLAALTGTRSNGRPVFLQAAVTPGGGLPTPSLRYRLDTSAGEAALSRQLSRSVAASLSTTYPLLDNGVAKSYNISVSYSF